MRFFTFLALGIGLLRNARAAAIADPAFDVVCRCCGNDECTLNPLCWGPGCPPSSSLGLTGAEIRLLLVGSCGFTLNRVVSGMVIKFQLLAEGPTPFSIEKNDNQRIVHNLILAVPECHDSTLHMLRNLTSTIDMKHPATFVLGT